MVAVRVFEAPPGASSASALVEVAQVGQREITKATEPSCGLPGLYYRSGHDLPLFFARIIRTE